MARGRSLALLLICAVSCSESPPKVVVQSLSQVAAIGGGNALTLPAQRHLVRLASGDWLLAVQQDGADGHGLALYHSLDGQSFAYDAAIQDDWSHRDTADLVAVADDVAICYSYEGPTLDGSTRHDVWFQWWRRVRGDFAPESAVRLFRSPSSASGYYRAELTRDSVGRFWVQAFRLEADGSSSAVVTVSTDGGASWQPQPDLGTHAARGGGRLLAAGGRVLFVWDGHDALSPARFRVRDDAAPLDRWGPEQIAFWEGIYHGAALSATEDGAGGIWLVYKDKNQVLTVRRFDGQTFGDPLTVDGPGEWELQAATTRVGSDLYIFYNHVVQSGYKDTVNVRLLRGGVLDPETVLDDSSSFKGYPAAAAFVSGGAVPCFFGVTPTANDGGQLVLYSVSAGIGPPPDLATPAPRDLAAPPDLALPRDGGAGLRFADSFARTSGLGSSWSVGAGVFYTDGRAVTDLDGEDRAAANVASITNGRVSARVIGFGVPETGVFLAAPSPDSPDRIDLVLLGDGRVRIRRVAGPAITVLGEAPSGLAALDEPATLELAAAGSTFTARVNGVVRITAFDPTPRGPGYAGLYTTNAGVVFADFRVDSF